MTSPRQSMANSRGFSVQFFFLGNLIFALLLAAGIFNSLRATGRLPDVHFGYVDYHQNLISKNKTREALPELRTAAAIDFDNAAVQLQLLLSAYEVNDAESVIMALRGLLSHTPDDAELHSKLAVALLELGHADEALLHIGRAVKLDPTNAGLRTTHGAILLTLGRLDEAAENYRKALELDPHSEAAHRALQFPLKNY
jgi:tetratricopeptide (TPR) repeat protein